MQVWPRNASGLAWWTVVVSNRSWGGGARGRPVSPPSPHRAWMAQPSLASLDSTAQGKQFPRPICGPQDRLGHMDTTALARPGANIEGIGSSSFPQDEESRDHSTKGPGLKGKSDHLGSTCTAPPPVAMVTHRAAGDSGQGIKGCMPPTSHHHL